MKKYFSIFATLLFVASCGQNGKPDGGSDNVSFEEPTYKAEAMKVVIDAKPGELGAPADKNGNTYTSFEVTEAGLIVIGKTTPEGTPLNYAGKLDKVEPISDNPSFTGKKYTDNNYGSVSVLTPRSGVQVMFEPKDDDPVTGGGTQGGNVSSGTDANYLCRTWNLTKTIVSVSGGVIGSAAVGTTFDGALNSDKVVEFLTTNGVSVSDDVKTAGYIVRDISFSQAGSIVVRFTSKDPVYANWKPGSASKSLVVSVNDPEINEVVNGGISGTYEFIGLDNNTKLCVVKFSASVVIEGATYKGNVEFRLTEQ